VSEGDEPIVGLAREIRRHAERFVNDDAGDPEEFARAIAELPEHERQRIVLDTFKRLAPDAQWAILEHTFGDAQIGAYLAGERDSRLAELERTSARRQIVTAARSAARLDTTAVPAGEQLTIGLFRESQVRAAIARGSRAESCARQVVLRHHSPGVYRVVEDVFNPRRGLFVTAEYDHRTWEAERLAPHALIRVGSVVPAVEVAGAATGTGSEAGLGFEPVLYPGGRFDVELGDGVRLGSLHVGFVLVVDLDVFAE
jgi:hypothetical protein